MLVASHVTRRFGAVTAVDNLDLRVAPGQLFCLLGANGAGKTTTINLFLGFLAPDRGTVTVAGINPVVDPKAARRKLAYIPENVALYPHLTGIECVDLFCRMGGDLNRLDPAALESLLERSGLTREQARRRVSGYSKGMRQKIGLAIAYAREAEALVLDEPLSGLDPAAASEFCAELVGIRDAGAAVLMTTHDLFRAKELGGTIGIMRAGRLVEQLQAKDIDAQELERVYLNHMRAAPDGVAAHGLGATA
ncbi:ABC transporter ATP-binding protein [Pseudenhygromyxa sp. WMMC2535]|uniref:ABC transporter ATP-binding protein n=1 Tax=Pseudenhygromyxa sp. WMMC2535 TaxID=2712867 RepID=UPI0015546019|nr:ABC transporter ATP-binding protein [Pseudenhygromyxa sp. WMMC2535]NVB39194.1 ABC transporter ATP-binding protein [Pseudenhygromyxa sp. WMMC2535]